MTSTIVESIYGKLRGQQQANALVWKGIPYAKPPIGNLRFRAPLPPEPWTEVREALLFGPSAIQASNGIMEFFFADQLAIIALFHYLKPINQDGVHFNS